MGTPAAPRIDDRLRQYIVGAPFFASPAEVTRQVGELAWQLGLTRPCYQQVRELMGGANRPLPPPPRTLRSSARTVLKGVNATLDFVYQYPGWGLEDWYRRTYRYPTYRS